MESRGIVIYAFKKATYGKLAYNLAISIKHFNPLLKVCVLTDGKAFDHLTHDQLAVFDNVISLSEEDLTHNGKFSAGKGKLSGYKYFPFDNNMIIDADSICVNSLDSLFEKCTKQVHAQVVSKYNQDSETWNCQWLNLKAVKESFKLPSEYNIFEINSSFMFVKKGAIGEALYNQALTNFIEVNSHKEMRKWGGGFPDELAFNVAFAQCGIDPTFEGQTEPSNETAKPIFFSTRFTNSWAFVFTQYHFIGFYGDKNFTDKSLQEQYDRMMMIFLKEKGERHIFKIGQLMNDKHVLNK